MFAALTSAFAVTVIDAPVLQSANLFVVITISVSTLKGSTLAAIEPEQPWSSYTLMVKLPPLVLLRMYVGLVPDWTIISSLTSTVPWLFINSMIL